MMSMFRLMMLKLMMMSLLTMMMLKLVIILVASLGKFWLVCTIYIKQGQIRRVI